MLAEALGCIKFSYPDILQKWPLCFMARYPHQVYSRKSLKIEIGGKWSPCRVTWYQLPEFILGLGTQSTNFIQLGQFADLFDILIEFLIADCSWKHIAVVLILLKDLNNHRIAWDDYKLLGLLGDYLDKIFIINLDNILLLDIAEIRKP